MNMHGRRLPPAVIRQLAQQWTSVPKAFDRSREGNGGCVWER
jgi:hypothetical protein